MFSESDRKNKIGSLRVGKAISLKNIGNWSRNLIVKLKESFFYFYLIYENQRSFYLWDDFCNFNYRTSLDWSLPVRTAHR